MKRLFVSFAFLLTALQLTIASASTRANIFCKNHGVIYSALSEDGRYACSENLASGTSICFVGPRSKALLLLNRDQFDWDEEWVEDGNYYGKYDLSYVWVDGPNEIKNKNILKRCTKDFFKKTE